MLSHAGRSDLAVEPLEQAIVSLRTLGGSQRANLAAALGDLANAWSDLGRTDHALAAGDEALAIERELGRMSQLATGLHLTGSILMDAGRHAEAEVRFGEALEAAEETGDLGLQGVTLQRLGGLQKDTGRTTESIETLRRALRLFQRAGDRRSEMRTCNLLGAAESNLGRDEPAEAWYRKALELAEEFDDLPQVSAARQNIAIQFQIRAGAAADAAERDRLLAAAMAEVEITLDAWQQMNDKLHEAQARNHLSGLHCLRGDLDRAEFEVRQALSIYKSLDHPDIWRTYVNLAAIAHNRGDESAAAKWQAKADARHAEAQRLAAGPDADAGGASNIGTSPDRQLMEAFHALAQAVHQARTTGTQLEPDVAEALARLSQAPPPLGTFGAFLTALAKDENVLLPTDLPDPIAELGRVLLNALQQS